jgi:WD40 repeat protein
MLWQRLGGKTPSLGQACAAAVMVLAACLAGAPVQSADGPNKAPDPKNAPAAVARTDLYGDPLPAGALARMGTVRFCYSATSIAYSPDGKVLAAGGADNHIRLYDAATGKEIRRLSGHQVRTFKSEEDSKGAVPFLVESVGEGNVTTLGFSPDGKTLASGGWDDMVRLWDVATGKELHKLDAHKGMVARVVFAPDGKVLASRGGIDGVLRLWDAASGAELRKIEGLSRVNPWRFYREAALAFSVDFRAVVASTRKAIVFYDVASGKETRKLEGYRDCMYVAFSPDGKLLAAGGLDDAGKEQYSLRLWDAAAGKELRRCELPKNEPVTGFAFSPDGAGLAALVAETDSFVFDVATGKVLHRLPHYWPFRIAYAPDGKTVVTIRGQALRLWDPATAKERSLDYHGHQSGVTSAVLSPDGKTVASGAEDVRLWDVATAKQVGRIASPGTAVAFAPDGKVLATVGRGRKTLHLWEADGGKEVLKVDGPRLLRAVVFSPDGKLLATGDEQATVRLYDRSTHKQRHEIDMKSGADSLSLAFSPDGKSLACAGAWNEGGVPNGVTLNLQKRVTIVGKAGFFVLLWDTDTGKEIRRFGGLKDNVKSVVFSPDGKTLAAASRDGRIALWETATAKELLHILAHPNHKDASFACAPSVAFSPDGKTLASAGTDRTVRLWDPVTARELARYQADAECYCVAFGQSGKTLLSGGADTAVIVWDLVHPVKERGKPNVIILGD